MDNEPKVRTTPLDESFVVPHTANEPQRPAHVQLPEATLSHALLEAAPDAIIIVNADGHIVMVNSQAERVFGYPRSELIGQPVETLLPEQLRALHLHHRADYNAAPHTRPMGIGMNLTARRKDGSTFPVEISLSALRTDTGMLVTSVIRDMTERRRAEAALRASEDRFARVFRASPVAMVLIRVADQSILDVNERFLQYLGYHRDEIIGHTTDEFHMFTDPVERISIIQMSRDYPSLHNLEISFHTKQGAPRDALAAVEHVDVGSQACILMLFQDITERRRAAEELEEQVQQRTAHLDALLQFSQELLGARRLDEVLQQAMDHALALVPQAQCGAIYLYDASEERLALRVSVGFGTLPDVSRPVDLGVIGKAFTNRRTYQAHSATEWATLQEQTPDEQAHLLQTMLDGKPPSGTIALPLLAHGQAIGVLALLRTTGDGLFAVEGRATLEGLANLTAAAILEEQSTREATALSQQLAHLEAQQLTLTERLTSTEAAMLQAARLAAVGQLAASIAHEINNPLYAARNSLYLLEEDVPASIRELPYLQIARDELARIAGIIERMRDFYRPDRGEFAWYDLNQLLEGTLALAGLNTQYTGIQVVFAPALHIPLLFGNKEQLRQVFLNLILNAIDAMPNGGTLTVRAIPGPKVVLIDVQDTGIGIPPDIRDRLFEPFFTNKSNGTGLGLSISAHIVTQHDGQIDVESTPGQGSTFRVVLPYEPHQQHA